MLPLERARFQGARVGSGLVNRRAGSGERQPCQGPVLLRPHDFEVLDAILDRLDVTEHHRNAAGEAELMGGVHYAHPLGGVRLQRCDAVAHAVHEDFPAATWNGAKPGGDKVPEDLLNRLVEELGEGDHFAGAEAMDVEAGEFFADVRQQVEIPLFGQLGVMPTLHEDLVAAQRNGFLDLAVHFSVRNHVGVGVLLGAPEGAELAVNVADVGVVDVAVHDVGDRVGPAPAVRGDAVELAATISQRAQLFQRQRV